MYFDIITSASGPRFPEASILFSLEALGMARLLLLALEKGFPGREILPGANPTTSEFTTTTPAP
jgi:hypothetical protein